MPDIDIGWKVKLDELQNQLRASGALSNTEIRKLVGEMQRQFKKAEKEASNSAKNAAKEWDKGLGSLKGSAQKVTQYLGGPFGQLGEIAFDLGGKLGGTAGALGIVGAGLAATSIAAVGMASAWKGLADAASAAEERAVKAGNATRLPPEARRSLAEYRDASNDLSESLDVLTVTVGGELAGSLGELATGTAVLIDKFMAWRDVAKDADSEFNKFRESMSGLHTIMLRVATLDISTKIKEAADEAENFTNKMREHDEAVAERTKVAAKLAEENETEIESLRALGMVYDDTAQLAKEANEARTAQSNAKDRLAEEKELLAALEADRLTYYEKVNAMHRGLAASTMAQDDAVAEHARAVAQETLKQQSEAAAAGFGRIIEGIDKQIDKQRQGFAATGEAMHAASDLTGALSDAIAKGAEDGTVAQKQAALTLFRVSQATAIAAAAVDAIRAGVALIPGFAFLGPGAPAAAAATAGAAFATASAGILAQSPPSFQRGGMVATPGSTPDHRVIQTRADEAVLTGRGVRALGGPTAVEAVNRGGGQQQPTIVNLHVDGRKLATARVDPLGSLLTGAPLGRRPLYG